MHNAGIMEMPTDDYWNYIADLTGDQSWRARNIRRIFQDIENCHYEPNGTAGHGFSGWLDSSQGDTSWLSSSADGAAVLRSIAESVNRRAGRSGETVPDSTLETLLKRDINAANLSSTDPLGIFSLVTHTNTTGRRVSPSKYVRDTLNDPAGYPLKLELNAFLTGIEWDPLVSGDELPVVMGVNFVSGESVYKADPRNDPSKTPRKRHVYVTKEVIIAGGAFNSPQILKTSGVGPADELKKFNITLVADLPGVGRNLGDNYEGAVLSLANKAAGNLGGSYAVYLNTSQSEGPRDIFMW